MLIECVKLNKEIYVVIACSQCINTFSFILKIIAPQLLKQYCIYDYKQLHKYTWLQNNTIYSTQAQMLKPFLCRCSIWTNYIYTHLLFIFEYLAAYNYHDVIKLCALYTLIYINYILQHTGNNIPVHSNHDINYALKLCLSSLQEDTQLNR